MEKQIEFLIPFDDSAVGDGGWRKFFPCRTVYHMGQTIDFTIDRAENMVNNFKGRIPDYDLPINTLHADEHGVYGRIADLRLGDNWVEWLPEFNDGAVEEIKTKGYKYASPEIVFEGFQGVYDGKEYRDVALAIAITPRPRLGRDTLVFSEGKWESYEGDDEDKEKIMTEVKLNEEQMGELKEGVFAQIGSFFSTLFKGNIAIIEPEVEEEQEKTPEPKVEESKFAEQLEEKSAEILVLEEKQKAQEAEMQELKDKAQKYDEQLRLAEEEAEKERQNARKLAFAETAKDIHGLPETELNFADELMWLEDADASEGKVHYNTLLNVLRALGEQEKTAELFGEIGNDGSVAKTVNERVDDLVAAKVKEGMGKADAVKAVFADNPGLYKEYDSENTKAIKSIRE